MLKIGTIKDRFLRRYFTKRYIRGKLSNLKEAHVARLKAVGISAAERDTLAEDFRWDQREYQEWLNEIESEELISKAKKMDVYLAAIPVPDDPDEAQLDTGERKSQSHFEHGAFGSRYLRVESHNLLLAATRERMPTYRKERREVLELWLKVILMALTAITGVVGAITGLVALSKK